jgi:chemotaxis protein histidine kinase CheA
VPRLDPASMPRYDDFEEDEWHERDYHRTSGNVNPYPRRSGDLLTPAGASFGSSLHRSRSTGASPAPNVYVYTSATQRNDVDARSPSPNPRGRRDNRTAEIIDKLDDIDRDIRRGASRSRGPDYRDTSPYYQNMQLELQRERDERMRMDERLRDRLTDLDRHRDPERRRDNEALHDAELRMIRLEQERHLEADKRERAQREEELYQKKMELQRYKERIERQEAAARLETEEKQWKLRNETELLREEEKRRIAELRRAEEKERILAEREREEKKAKAERDRIKLEIERKEREEAAERKALLEQYQADAAKKKRKEEDEAAAAVAQFKKKEEDEKKKKEELKAQFKREEEEKKAKDKEEEEKWKAKIAAKEKAEKDKKKAHEKELEDEMHRKLAVYGFQENQIEAVLKPKKVPSLAIGLSPLHPRPALEFRTETPTYIKVKREHVDIETLRYFGLPWEYDTVSSLSPLTVFLIQHTNMNIHRLIPTTSSFSKRWTRTRPSSSSSTRANFAAEARHSSSKNADAMAATSTPSCEGDLPPVRCGGSAPDPRFAFWDCSK